MENNQKQSTFQGVLTWGLITGIASIVYTFILYFAGLMQNKPIQYAGIIITIVCLYLGIKAVRDQYLGGVISYGKSLGTGVLISLFSTIVSLIFLTILYTVIDQGLIDLALQDSIEKMTERGMSSDQIEQGMAMARRFFIPSLLIGGLFFGTFLGFLISLVLSAFLKKEENLLVNPNA
ncbi:MAG TPA: hypothetical protein DIW31_09525 [Bacteroidales bacterium]|nr:hypothetical protein [Bacteroidales bacterium]